jgi:hypothetical protein
MHQTQDRLAAAAAKHLCTDVLLQRTAVLLVNDQLLSCATSPATNKVFNVPPALLLAATCPTLPTSTLCLNCLPADILEAAKSKTDTSSIGDKVTGAADDAKDKAKGLLKGKGLSALPANPLAAVADQNADVRDAATGYRDPAGAVQLDAASGGVDLLSFPIVLPTSAHHICMLRRGWLSSGRCLCTRACFLLMCVYPAWVVHSRRLVLYVQLGDPRSSWAAQLTMNAVDCSQH